jgi:hypothetical protein
MRSKAYCINLNKSGRAGITRQRAFVGCAGGAESLERNGDQGDAGRRTFPASTSILSNV